MSKIAQLTVIRSEFFDDTTIGQMFLNNEFVCYTLEDAVRGYGVKVKGKTAIPRGEYKGKISRSSRFKRDMVMVYTESNGYELKNGGISFKGIRIHGGNTHKNTDGCILIAHRRPSTKTIQGTAEKTLLEKLKDYDEIIITIIHDFDNVVM